ncbi:MAG TPA: metallophosphoesterase family protein [Patescibacteria group bacterium]|nr:metallophosphoesterase family protein [Patescibacteria group bacterium]
MGKMRFFIHSLNENLLFILCTFLLIFIPLFPKIPLFDILPGYIVRVRPEDFLVLCTAIVWLRDVRAKRVQWNTSYFWFVFLYACAGLLSIALGIFLLQTIPLQLIHVGKSALHFMRYLEYFSVFFFLFSAVKTKKQVAVVFAAIVITILGVVGYGFGQKYAHFPVYSTMNREYSKGEKLYLENDARPQSTFAGHYDLAAFLVIVLPLIFSLSLGAVRSSSLLTRAGVFITLQAVHLLGFTMLILTASAISLVGYMIAMTIVLLFHLARLPTIRQRFFWGFIVLCVGVISTGLLWTVLPQRIKDKAMGFVQKTTERSTPTDLVGDGYETKTIQTKNPDGSISIVVVQEKSTWSENALKYGLSMGIRLDTLWPQAGFGFVRNPFSGSGYGTLAMLDTQKFIEADSTDNNFFRTLGETGVLGFFTFYGVIFFLLQDVFRAARSKNGQVAAASIGFTGSILGLLTTAAYLDVFAASKVAFIFWAIAGIVVKISTLERGVFERYKDALDHVKKIGRHFYTHWPLYTVFVLSFFLLHQNPYMEHNPAKDLEYSVAGVEQLASARCFLQFKRFDLCRNTGLTLQPHTSFYVLLLTPMLALLQNYGAFYYLNLTLILITIFVTYIIVRHRVQKNHHIFFMLSLIPLVSALLHFTYSPLTDLQFFILVIFFPLIAYWSPIALRKLTQKHVLSFLLSARGLFTLFVGTFIYVIFFSGMTARFRNIVSNHAYYAVQLANASLSSTLVSQAFLITTLNPYFVDLYSSNHYALLPLSSSQPYARLPAKVWGISNTADLHSIYKTLLESRSTVLLSDFGIRSKREYLKDFIRTKQSFDLSYKAFGCNEQCNLFELRLPQPIISNKPKSPFSANILDPEALTLPYQFSIISNRFDIALIDRDNAAATQMFVKRALPVQEAQNSFLLLTGDAINDTASASATYFTQEFAEKLSYPILYAAGNHDTIPKKYFSSDFQTFFTNSEYFILLNVDENSHLNTEQQLRFYTALLQLEKLPQIKNVFIIANDLNWQHQDDSINAIHMIERKLNDFPYLNTYIVTANHALQKDAWFEVKHDKKLNRTYVSSLTAGNIKDRYIQVTIDEQRNVYLREMRLE